MYEPFGIAPEWSFQHIILLYYPEYRWMWWMPTLEGEHLALG